MTTKTTAAKAAPKTAAKAAPKTTVTRAAAKPAAKPAARAAAKPATRAAAKPAAKPAVVKEESSKPKKYVLLSGIDDAEFCQRVSDRMEQGYELYGSPAITFNGKNNIVCQALVLKKHKKRK